MGCGPNIKAKTLRNTRVSICDLGLGSGFLDTTSKVQLIHNSYINKTKR